MWEVDVEGQHSARGNTINRSWTPIHDGIGTWHLQYGFEDGVAKLMPAMRCYPRLCVFGFVAAWILLLAHSPCSPIVSLREQNTSWQPRMPGSEDLSPDLA